MPSAQLVHKKDRSTWNQSIRKHWDGVTTDGTLTEGTWEAEWHPDLHTHASDVIVTKTRGSAFVHTELENILVAQRIGTVVLTGYSIDRCVGLAAIDAWERDFEVLLSGEAILGTNQTEDDLMQDYLANAFDITGSQMLSSKT